MVLDERRHLRVVCIGSDRENGELQKLPISIEERGFAVGAIVPGKPGFLEECTCAFERPGRMSEFLIPPSPVARCYQSPKPGAMSLIDEPHDLIAIHCRENRLTALRFTEPLLFPLHLSLCFFTGFIQIEKEKIVFEPWSSIHHGVTALLTG